MLRILAIALFFATVASPASARTFKLFVPASPDPATQEFIRALITSPSAAEAGITFEQIVVDAFGSTSQIPNLLKQGVANLAFLPANAMPNFAGGEDLIFTRLISSPAIVADSREHFAIQDSAFGGIVANEIGRQGLVVLSFWNRQPSALALRRRTRVLSDIKGAKIRTPPTPSVAVLQGLGASPTPLPFAEVYTAVKNGLVDGAEISLDSSLQTVLEVMRGGSLLAEYQQWQGFFVTAEEFWIDITQKERALLQKAAEEAAAIARSAVLAAADRTPALADQYGLTYAKFSDFAQDAGLAAARDAWLRQGGATGARALQILNDEKNRGRVVPGRRGNSPNRTTTPTRVLFATTRNDENAPELPYRFGVKRDPSTVLTCGEISYTRDSSRKFGASYSGAMSLAAGGVKRGPSECARLVADAAISAGGSLNIYLHGFWNSFDKTVRRAVGITDDLAISAPILVWSWPSLDSEGGYVYDLRSVNFSLPYLENFAKDLFSAGRIRDTTLIAHSMGSVVALDLLKIGGSQGKTFQNVVLAAPDVPQTNFQQSISLYGKYAELSTFYANSDDRALTISWTVNREAPAGLAGTSLLVIDGIETIDVSKADSNWLDIINHSVAFEAPIIASDVERLLRAREKASVRGLPRAMHKGKPYWFIAK